MTTKRKTFTHDEKRSFVEQVNRILETSTRPIKSACKEVGLDDSNYYRWSKQFGSASRKQIRSSIRPVARRIGAEPNRAPKGGRLTLTELDNIVIVTHGVEVEIRVRPSGDA